MAGSIQKYGNDYIVKTGNGSRNNSGPSGSRKMRGRNIMARNLADSASTYAIVLWCSDQHKNRGTGQRAKWASDNRGRLSEAMAGVRIAAVQGMRMEHVQ